MAAIRLGNDQKADLVERYRRGEATQDLAAAFGCSPNTVIRLVKGALGEDLYGQLKRQRGSRGTLSTRVVAAPGTTTPEPAALAAGGDAAFVPADEDNIADLDADGDDDATPGVLAIDDADDFGAEDSDEGVDDGELEDSDEEPDAGGVRAEWGGLDRDREANIFVTVPVGVALEDRPPATCRPLEAAPLPDSLYMLVDKTVELQTHPLSDFPELGPLPDGEQRRQALVVFANPRQAKRHCGRTQRVIKLPDSQVIHRTAPYLLGQGITRLVLEGAVYSLPGS
ncbi:helix-turn-helix domain-containing protein [Synechococcus sp. Tobar12-5m-g]|uniref:helix-turn-helix domain-containing protein n=1 Tax=unclassified Synechococcus TaxID=2626047 RepID=UPI0020CFB1DD|nr:MULTISPECIES: helix-turn-helix domain-containing protein [unclassified Synechococcus]MCP9771654.1 helix-turn-helix domain-containing protein [Synechococcus sp. Tobar12-5m-g]MCP9872595.1 helix-turn-helix domain-containing protein [Synechococcus sp. Cruz CV-v-12]